MRTIEEHPTEALLDGRYQLGPCVGRGGAAVVYRAEDRVLGRTVAVKILRQADDGTASDPERAHREAGVLAGLNHPSLVTLYDARLDPGHPRYLAMEYVDGPTLSMRLTDGVLSEQDAASLAHDVGRALQTVHSAGIIHRDVKPSNVLLAPPLQAGRPWTAKLTDFGIAYEVDDPRSTSPGVVIGTAAYMAPEQVRGEKLTAAVDIYSLGLVLIEALSGTPAFPLSNRIQTALSRLSRDPAIPDSLSAEWRELLSLMTRTDPQARPSAGDVAEAATALMGGAAGGQEDPVATRAYPAAAITAPPTSAAPNETPRRVRRRRRGGALAIAGAIIASSVAISWTASLSATPERIVTVVTHTPNPDSSEPSEIADSGTSGSATTTATTGDQKQGGAVNSQTGDTKANPNKGPGQNSGNSKQAPGQANGD